MDIILLHAAYQSKEWFWLTLLNIDFKSQSRSLLHIERDEKTWKIQFLWLKNNCWVIKF